MDFQASTVLRACREGLNRAWRGSNLSAGSVTLDGYGDLRASVGLRENALFLRALAAKNTFSFAARLFHRYAAHRGLSFFLNLGFALRASTPIRPREPCFHRRLEFGIVFRL